MPNQFISYTKSDSPDAVETLKIASTGVKALIRSFHGQVGEYWVSVIPSLNVSGYGVTEKESREDMEYNMDLFFEDIWKLDTTQRLLYLKELGWDNNKLFKKQFSKAFVDENGVLQNFDHPELVKKSLLQTA